MKKLVLTALATITWTQGVAFGYDPSVAAALQSFYGKLDFDKLATSNLFIKADELAMRLKNGEAITMVDIRTPQEQAFIKVGYPSTLSAPLTEVFTPKVLDTIPVDQPVVIVCHSGTRATPVVMNLRMLGFKNVQALEGGIVALAQVSAPKSCPTKK